MMWQKRLKRRVAPGLRALGLAGGRRQRPDAGGRHPRRAGAPGPLRELVALAGPIAAAMLGDSAMGLVDTKLVGGLGVDVLGGVGMGVVLMYLGYSLVFGLMRGVKVRAAYAVGEKRPEDARRYAEAGILLALVTGTLLFAVTRDATPILRLLRVDEPMIAPARDFLAARTSAAWATFAFSALVQYRQGLGDSRTPMIVALLGNVVNAVLAWALIYGHFGLPALGVKGAGYGTAIAELFEALALGAVVLAEARADRRRGMPPPRVTRAVAVDEVLRLGVPTGLHFGLESLAFTTFTALIASLGAAEIAAHQVALNTIRASFLPGIAVSEAASVLVARSLGEGRLDEADRVTRTAIRLGATFMTACGLVFALTGGMIARSFSPDPHVVAIARQLLLVAAVFQTLDAVNVILRGALRGAKDVRWVAIVGTSIVWFCVPGAALLLGRMAGLGALGGWLGFVCETTIASTVLWLRWTRGPWRRAYPTAAPADAPALAPASA